MHADSFSERASGLQAFGAILLQTRSATRTDLGNDPDRFGNHRDKSGKPERQVASSAFGARYGVM